MILIIMSTIIAPQNLNAQGDEDIEAQRSQKVQTWIDNYAKGFNIAKPVLETVRSEHQDFYGKFGDALTVLDIYIKVSNAQDWQAFEAAMLLADAKLIDFLVNQGALSSAFKGALTVFTVAKLAMGVFKTFVFDPYLMNDAVDRYYGMREIGNEPGDAIAIIGAIGNIRQQLLGEFRKIYGDLVFEDIAPSGLILLDSWEPRFQEFSLAFFENAYAQRKFQEMKEEMERKKEEVDREMPALESQMIEIIEEVLDRTESLSIAPTQSVLEIGEAVQFTATATNYRGDQKDVTSEALVSSSFTADAAGSFTVTANYEGQTATATIVVNEPEEEDPVSLTLSPSESTIKIGDNVDFTATAVYEDGSTTNVSNMAGVNWSIGGSSFTANEAGEFSVSVSFMGLSAQGVITVEEETQCNEPSEILDETGSCVCNREAGYERNEELGRCVSIDDAIDEATEDGEELCDEEVLAANLARLDELVASGNRIAANFQATLNKFLKEVNDQNSNPCENSIIAVAYAGAKESLAEYELLVDEATRISTDLILEGSLCPLEEINLDITSILQKVSQLGPPQGQIEDGIATMENQLQTFGCDEQEVEDQGDTIAEQSDPEVLQAGGAGATETCGDGIDNDGDGLIDEDCEGTGNFNVIIVLYDSGSAADDIFGLSVSGQGNLGTTPEGGSRTYPLRLSPGSYVATVTVISAPDNTGTYTIRILEGDQEIAGDTGGPPQGTVVNVPFTVSGEAEASAETESILPRMMNFLRQIEQSEGGNN